MAQEFGRLERRVELGLMPSLAPQPTKPSLPDRRNLLLISDDVAFASGSGAIFANLGPSVDVRIVRSFENAIHTISGPDPYDFMVVDMNTRGWPAYPQSMRSIRDRQPDALIMILVDSLDTSKLETACRGQADFFLMKKQSQAQLAQRLSYLLRVPLHSMQGPFTGGLMPPKSTRGSLADSLVVEALDRGRTPKQIANELGMSLLDVLAIAQNS